MVKALCRKSVSHFQAAREDRDGRSRYRASKMPHGGELGWYRDSRRPYVRGGVYFFVIYYGGYSNG